MIALGDDSSESSNPRIFSSSTGLGFGAAGGGETWFYDGTTLTSMADYWCWIDVGIGTNAPNAPLVVAGAAGNQVIFRTNEATASQRVAVDLVLRVMPQPQADMLVCF